MSNSKDDTFKSTSSPQTERDLEQFAPGTILATKYKVISTLGKGGMGTVYRVEQIFLQLDLALKVLDRKSAFNEIQVKRFQAEARAAFSLSHPSLVKVHDYGVLEDGQPYLVMDYVPGETLAELISKQGALSIEQIEKIFPQACFGIAYAHQQAVIHRDLKPSNIMLVDGVPLGKEGSVKIVDFGIAKIAAEEGGEVQALTKTGEIFGSPLYMSPEQCSGEQVDARTDVYSLGCLLFEALTGTTPLVGNNALRTMLLHQSQAAPTLKEASMGKDFPLGFEQIVQKMLQKIPSDRYENLGEVAHEIMKASQGKPVAAAKNSHSESQKSAAAAAASSGATSKYIIVGVAVAVIVGAGTYFVLMSTPKMDKVPTEFGTTKLTETSPKPDEQSFSTPSLSDTAKNWNAYENGDLSTEELKQQIEEMKACKPIKQAIVQRYGKRKKQFFFPPCFVGRISNRIVYNRTFGRTPYGKVDAKGDTLVPADTPLTYEVNPHSAKALFHSPTFFEKIDPSAFEGLQLSTRMPTTLGSQMSEDLQNLAFSKMLNIASKWSNLRTILLLDLPKSKDTIDVMNKFPHLEHFHISAEKAAEDLIGQPFLRKLKHLGLEEVQVGGVLQSLEPANRLEFIDLDNTRASASDIATLAKFKQLKQLEFCETPRHGDDRGITDEQLKALIQLKQLKVLYIKDTPLTLAQLRLLQSTGKNTHICVSSRARDAVEQLRPKDPRIEMIVEH